LTLWQKISNFWFRTRNVWEKFGNAARIRAREHFSIQRQVKDIKRDLRSLWFKKVFDHVPKKFRLDRKRGNHPQVQSVIACTATMQACVKRPTGKMSIIRNHRNAERILAKNTEYSGGEPSLIEELPEILSEIKNRWRPFIRVVHNGTGPEKLIKSFPLSTVW